MRLQRWAAAASLVLLASGLAACDGTPKDGDVSNDPPAIIEITENAGKITPDDGHVVNVQRGQEVELNVSSDASDVIRVASRPKAHAYKIRAGQDKTFTFTIDIPGRYAISSRDLGTALVTLRVR